MILKNHMNPPVNSQKSQSFGRLIYKLEIDGRMYWLKMHIHGGNLVSEHAFLNELVIYQDINQKINESSGKQQSLLLPFQIIKTAQLLNTEIKAVSEAILIEDSKGLFDDQPCQLNHAEILNILLKSLDAVSKLHEIGYLHGDLKVEHFRMLSKNSFSSLIDFEQTAPIHRSTHANITATPRYMAPELFHAAQKSPQTDIYALGIIWLEWLNEKRMQKNTYIEWAYLHCQQLKVTLPTQFEFLQVVLEAMLAKNNQQRFENIYQIKQRLSAFV